MDVNPLLGNRFQYDSGSGSFVSAQHQRIAEILKDYNPELSLMWIPPANRGAGDTKPYVVVHKQSDGNTYPVFYLDESELDHRVLARIFAADMKRNNANPLADLEAAEAAQKILEAKEYEDAKAEKFDFAEHVLKSKLHSYRHNGKVYT